MKDNAKIWKNLQICTAIQMLNFDIIYINFVLQKEFLTFCKCEPFESFLTIMEANIMQ